uniref:Uncharacterized protein n=1 Tax=Guillardia theta (strain CCMP2712) TaxID=905079 RepID=A0A0C3TYL3_GUITC
MLNSLGGSPGALSGLVGVGAQLENRQNRTQGSLLRRRRQSARDKLEEIESKRKEDANSMSSMLGL